MKSESNKTRKTEGGRDNPVNLKIEKNRKSIYLVCVALVAVFIIAVSIVLRGVSEKRVYDNYMQQAQQCYSASDFDSALSVLRKAAAIYDTDDCRILMADCYETQGNYVKALEVLRGMDIQNPNIAARIAAIDKYRQTLNEAEKVTVAGSSYPLNTTSLVLDNMGLTDTVLAEVVQLYALDSLSVAGNSLYDVSRLTELGALVTLNLADNNVSSIQSLSQLGGLRTLYLDNNPITDLTPLYTLSNLTNLSIKGIHITEKQLEELSLSLPRCAIHSELAEHEIQDISFGGVTFKSDVTELDLSGLGLRDISALSGCKALTKLDISGNAISDLTPLMNIPGLYYLDVSGNQLTDLRPIMGLNNLSYLNAADNSISSCAPFSMMPDLAELYLDNNPLRNFSGLRKLKNIKTLSLNNTGIGDDGLAYLGALSYMHTLNVEDNPAISGEAVDNLSAMLGTCNINHDALAYTVNVGGTQVSTAAVNLTLCGRGITDISELASLPMLETVDLSANSISNIYALQFSESRFSLKSLNLSNNQISDVTPVSLLMSIETLDLSNNLVNSELPFMTLTTLRTLNLSGNPLTEMQVDTIRFALPDCNVIF